MDSEHVYVRTRIFVPTILTKKNNKIPVGFEQKIPIHFEMYYLFGVGGGTAMPNSFTKKNQIKNEKNEKKPVYAPGCPAGPEWSVPGPDRVETGVGTAGRPV